MHTFRQLFPVFRGECIKYWLFPALKEESIKDRHIYQCAVMNDLKLIQVNKYLHV